MKTTKTYMDEYHFLNYKLFMITTKTYMGEYHFFNYQTLYENH